MEPHPDFETACRLLRAAGSISVLPGAGVSAESGVPTFRGADGLWRQCRPEDLATPQAFVREPRLVGEWSDRRRGPIAVWRPNPAHLALVEIDLEPTPDTGRLDVTLPGRAGEILPRLIDQ
ncbi:MAG: hypothetical protein KKC37_09965 [Proteobacteria bacterium]|nr:hypothetical protein [Pseudomonadota bacterium]